MLIVGAWRGLPIHTSDSLKEKYYTPLAGYQWRSVFLGGIPVWFLGCRNHRRQSLKSGLHRRRNWVHWTIYCWSCLLVLFESMTNSIAPRLIAIVTSRTSNRICHPSTTRPRPGLELAHCALLANWHTQREKQGRVCHLALSSIYFCSNSTRNCPIQFIFTLENNLKTF